MGTHERLQWLRRMRGASVALYGAAGAYLFFSGVLLEERLRVPFFGILASLALFHAVLALRERDGRSVPPLLPLAVDLAGFTAVLVCWGGTQNPFVALLVGFVALAALLLEGAAAIAFLPLVAVSLYVLHRYRGLQVIRGDVLDQPALVPVALFASAVATWVFVGTLRRLAKRAEDESRRWEERHRKLERQRLFSAAAAQLSHRLASPLATAQLLAERFLRRADWPEKDRQLAERLHDSLRRSAAALDDLRLAASGTALPTLESVDASELVARTVSDWLRAHPSESASVVVSNDAVAAPRLLAPRIALGEALQCLLDNAAEAAGSSGRVEVSLEEHAGTLAFVVRDDGPGIDPSIVTRLGEPFVTTRPQGNGLGLYQCSALADALGGEFSLRNRPLRGAEARLVVPRGEGA